MAEVNPPDFEAGECYTAENWRHVFDSIVCTEGVVDLSTDLVVTAVGGVSRDVNVSGGDAWIEGDINGSSGMYHVRNTTQVTKAIDVNAAGSLRYDLIIASVYDAQYIGASKTWAIEVIKGTAGAGVPAVPDLTRVGYIILAVVEVPISSGAPSVVEDVRPQMQLCGGGWRDFVPDIQGVTADVVMARYTPGNGVITATYELLLTAPPTGVVEVELPVPIREGNVNFYNPGSGLVLFQGNDYYQATIQTISEDYFRFYWPASPPEVIPINAGQGWLANDRLFCTIVYEPKLV